MRAVVGRPPEDALLSRGLREKREAELPEPIELEGSMAEKPVIPPGDAEHPEVIRTEAPEKQGPTARNGQNQEDRRMHEQKGQHGAEVVVLPLERNYIHVWDVPMETVTRTDRRPSGSA